MGIDLSRFKVVHGEKVLNAVALMEVQFGDRSFDERETIEKPNFMTKLDRNIISIHDEAWTFQFIPIIAK